MFVINQDFECTTDAGIVLCAGLKPEVTSTFKVLQLQLSRLIPHLPNAPKIELVVDGIIGPSVALSLQMIVTRIARGYPNVLRDLGALIYAPAEQMIVETARYADVLTGYIDQIITHNPNAVRSPPPLADVRPEDPLAFAKRVFTPKRLIAGGVTLAGLAGLAVVVNAADNRALGRVDRSHFLPASDGTDDDGSDDDGDGGYENVIDIPAHEPAVPAPSPEA